MQNTIRPFILAGIAFAGAGVVALTPIRPNLPDIQMPAIATPALELAALPSYLEWVQEGTDAAKKNVPSYEYDLPADFTGALSAAVELGSNLFQGFDDATTTITTGNDLVQATQTVQAPLEFINTVQAMLTNPSFIPTIVDDLVEVVQGLAANTVEPVLNVVLKITAGTLYRLSNIMKASIQDIPLIVATVFTAAGEIFATATTSMSSVVGAALTNPLTVVDAIRDGLIATGTKMSDHIGNVVAAVDQYRVDLETALVTSPPSLLPASASSIPVTTAAPPKLSERIGTPTDRAAASPGDTNAGKDADKGSDSSPSTGGSKLDVSPGPLFGPDPAVEAPAVDPAPETGAGPTRSNGKPSSENSDDKASSGKSGSTGGPKRRPANP